MSFYRFNLFLAFLVILTALSLSYSAEAARLYLTPSGLSVSVYVDSSDQAMNAASGIISFPSDRLQVSSLSKVGSIFDIWVQEPVFSNSAGTINFEGLVLNPGYNGAAGKLLTVNFKGKKSGNALLAFDEGSVLANDGLGTNILKEMSNVQIVVGESISVSSQTPDSKIPIPIVSSLTHPDTEKWYSNNDPKFEWLLPSRVSGVNLLADRNPETDPGTKSDGLFKTVSYKDVGDGIWYLHIRFKVDSWGQIARFPFRIDTEKPEQLNVRQITSDLPHQAEFLFTAHDKTSGIDHYLIQIDNGEEQVWNSKGSNFKTGKLGSGYHTLTVKAVDRAGNFSQRSIDFEVGKVKSSEIVLTLDKQTIYLALLIILAIVLVIYSAFLHHKINLLEDRLRRKK